MYVTRSVLDQMKRKYGMGRESDRDFLEWWRRTRGTGYEAFEKIEIIDDRDLPGLARKLKECHSLKYAFLVPRTRRGGIPQAQLYYHDDAQCIPPGWILVLTNRRGLKRRRYAIPEEDFCRLDEPELKAKILSGAL